MTKGRKSQPNALKQLKGTQPVRMNKDEPESEAISKLPRAPRWFTDTAKSIYYSTGKHLAGSRVLSQADLEMFISFCNEYAKYLDTEKEMQSVPLRANLSKDSERAYRRVERQNRAAWERSMKLASEFGITPAARAKAQAIATGKEEKDPMDDL
jgi:P27 family predicted phage terminase small subunit